MRTSSDNRDSQNFSSGQEMDDEHVAEGADASVIVNREALKAIIDDIGSYFLLLPVAATKTMLHAMKQPIRRGNALILGTYIMLVMASYTSASVLSDGIKVLNALCSMPLISTVPICGMIREAGMREPFPELVEQQMGFASLMDLASLNSNLALDLMHTEMAVKDLHAEIKVSDIESRDVLMRSLSDIAVIAKQGNHQLIALQSGVGNAVDCILAMNEWAVESLERSNRHKTRSMLSAVIFGSLTTIPPSLTEITGKFNEIAALMEAKLHRLVSMAQITIATLTDLDGALDALQGVHLRAVKGTQLQKDQVLATMWASVAQRREKLASYTRNFNLLSDVEKSRSTAALKVSETLMQLLKLQEDLDNLRREVEPSRPHQSQPQIEVVLKILRKGVERLSAARAVARDTNWQSRKRMFLGPQYPEL